MFFKQFVLGVLLMGSFADSSATFLNKVSPERIELCGKVAIGVGTVLVIHGLMREIKGETNFGNFLSACSKVLELSAGAAIFAGGGYAFVFSEKAFVILCNYIESSK